MSNQLPAFHSLLRTDCHTIRYILATERTNTMMHALVASLVLSFIPTIHSLVIPSSSGFKSPVVTLSAGLKAQCIQGYIPVTTSATNENILLSEPANQYAATELFLQYLAADSNFSTTVNGGSSTVSGTYNINAKLCYPITTLSVSSLSSILFLIHGIGYDKSYWDLASGYSFVDAAAAAGYATFSYDRLGTGLSDHPDPIQVVQSTLQVNIAHALIQMLRAGSIANHAFSKVAGIGHSYGSIQTVGIANQYPKDLDAVILQGFSIASSGLGLTFADFNSAIANQNQPDRFASLPNACTSPLQPPTYRPPITNLYFHIDFVTSSAISDQFAFFTYPNFPTSLFTQIDAAKQPFSLGDVITLASVVAPATSYTGPVDVVLGDSDLIFCQANCYYPSNQAALVRPALFPAANVAGSRNYLVGGTGHAVNAHYNATLAFAQMVAFVKDNGL